MLFINMIYPNNLLFCILLIPLLGSIFLMTVSFKYSKFLKSIALTIACITFVFSLILWFFFDKSLGSFQFCTSQVWFLEYSLTFSLGVDGISLFFVILTTLLIPICLLISWTSVNHSLKIYLVLF